MTVFCVIVLAFSCIYTLNFGGQTAAYSGLGTTFRSLVPHWLHDPPQEGTTSRALSTTVNALFALIMSTFLTSILVAIILSHYNQVKVKSGGRLVDEGLLRRCYRIISKTFPPVAADWMIRKAEEQQEATTKKHEEDVHFGNEDRKRLMRLEEAQTRLLGTGPALQPAWRASTIRASSRWGDDRPTVTINQEDSRVWT